METQAKITASGQFQKIQKETNSKLKWKYCLRDNRDQYARFSHVHGLLTPTGFLFHLAI